MFTVEETEHHVNRSDCDKQQNSNTTSSSSSMKNNSTNNPKNQQRSGYRIIITTFCFLLSVSLLYILHPAWTSNTLTTISTTLMTWSTLVLGSTRSSSTEAVVVTHNLQTLRSLGAKLKVVKTYHDRSVYVVDGENVRHLVPDWSTFLTLGYDVGDIITLTEADMEALKIGDPLDPIHEEPTPPNPYAGCPCISQNQFLVSIKKKDESTATDGNTEKAKSDSSSSSASNNDHHHVCLVDNENTKHFLTLYSSLTLHKMTANSMTFSKISSNFTQSLYQKLTTKPDELKQCDMVMEFTKKADLYKYTCPEQCFPVPYTLVSLAWLQENAFLSKSSSSLDRQTDTTGGEKHELSIDTPLTCSMTWRQLFVDGSSLHHHHNHNKDSSSGISNSGSGSSRKLSSSEISASSSSSSSSSSHHHTSIGLILKAIVRRRVEECFEREFWPSAGGKAAMHETTHSYSSIAKRPVHGFIIWVGSRTRYDLMEDQIKILTHTTKFSKEPSFHKGQGESGSMEVSDDLIAGWLASEDQYSCRVGSTVCEAITSSMAYYHYMPTTRMNVASAGWSCAQRRPLRALAHTLLLYDMNYLLIVDDDTYVSINILLSSPFKSYVRKHLMTEPSIVGQLTHGKKVTRRGFYWGGSGYLIGKVIIDRLNSFEIEGPRETMNVMIDPTMMRDLSVFNQVFPMSQQFCAGCIAVHSTNTSTPPLANASTLHADANSVTSYIGLTATSKVRLAEICVNLMAQEHTCYHSDHSLSRCFIHGAYAYPLDAECGGTNFPEGLFMGMCMGVSECDTKSLLTCHRYRPYHVDYTKAYGYYTVNNETLADRAIPHKSNFPESETFYERNRRHSLRRE